MNRTILQGDVLDCLDKLSDQSIQSVVTSVPFFGVRDYKVSGQWGLEKDLGMYHDRMNQLMDKLRRVLKRDGTVWIEIGDKRVDNSWLGIPETFMVDQIRKGWGIVSKPIWQKPNAFPLSTQRMFSPKYTNFYGFSKNPNYYFNLDAVKVTPKTPSKKFNVRVRDTDKEKFLQKATRKEKDKRQNTTLGSDGRPLGHYEGFNGRYDHEKVQMNGKNPGDFWGDDIFKIPVKPFKGINHYAIFPEAIPERLVRVSCPENQTILDPFMGSGTTGVVCERQNRNWIGIELKKEFCEFAIKRIGVGKIIESS